MKLIKNNIFTAYSMLYSIVFLILMIICGIYEFANSHSPVINVIIQFKKDIYKEVITFESLRVYIAAFLYLFIVSMIYSVFISLLINDIKYNQSNIIKSLKVTMENVYYVLLYTILCYCTIFILIDYCIFKIENLSRLSEFYGIIGYITVSLLLFSKHMILFFGILSFFKVNKKTYFVQIGLKKIFKFKNLLVILSLMIIINIIYVYGIHMIFSTMFRSNMELSLYYLNLIEVSQYYDYINKGIIIFEAFIALNTYLYVIYNLCHKDKQITN